MSWSRTVLGGLLAGVAVWLASFVMHGLILGETYTRYPVFNQEPANALYFLFVEICVGLTAALLFAKTRSSWGEGLAGGATFGFFLGLVSFFPSFFNPLVLEGFPYFLAWCWGGTNLIGGIVIGAALGLVIKRG